MWALREQGYYTSTISPFIERHAAWPVTDGFCEVHNATGDDERIGLWQPTADEVLPQVESWLDRNVHRENWFLHVNFWDPHTPYATPAEFGNPFEDDPIPEWLTEEQIDEHLSHAGPHSAYDPFHFSDESTRFEPDNDVLRVPTTFQIDSREAFRQWVDGYDVGVRYMDTHLKVILARLKEAGVFKETLVIVSADHGENLGELNVYGDHQTADEHTCNVPLVMCGPSVEPGVDDDFHYNVDLAPTVAELVGGEPGTRWDGQSFASSVTDGESIGREYLVFGQSAHVVQRSVRWDHWLFVRTYHDGYKTILDDVMLFDLESDPHETENLAGSHPEVVETGFAKLGQWTDARLLEAACDENGGNPLTPSGVADPIWQVIAEGGPYHVRVRNPLPRYLERLRKTGRSDRADELVSRHAQQLSSH